MLTNYITFIDPLHTPRLKLVDNINATIYLQPLACGTLICLSGTTRDKISQKKKTKS